jgi:hypothetical protein
MADEDDDLRPDPERSSAEIRQLLRKLDPQAGGGHKDRARRLARFRNYVEVDPRTGFTPEFYDDDLPLLLLGSHAPAAILDEELVGQKFYGLLQACGTPSSDHDHMLKRSARPAMALLKYLVLDWKEHTRGKPVDHPPEKLNAFAYALCNCTLEQLKLMNLELHIEGDKRGGNMTDACRIIVLICSRHLADDGETTAPLKLEELLPTVHARRRFESWLAQQATKAEKIAMKSVESLAAKVAARETLEELDDEDEDYEDEDEDEEDIEGEIEANSVEDFDGDVLVAYKRRNKQSMDKNEKRRKKTKGPATRWDQCDLYKVLQAKAALDQRGSQQFTVRDSQEAMAEKVRMEEEKAKALQKDPLGIRTEKDFDLGKIESLKVDLLVQALKDIDDEFHEIEQEREKNLNTDKDTLEEYAQRIRNLESQKESLESVLDSITTMGSEEAKLTDRSILTTDPHFDPILFLTLVHRTARYEVLNESMQRLSNKTDNQVQQLQNLVRDNFALFVRCADGIDVFNTREGEGVEERMDSLEGLALVCSDQARRSFKPLLDNTNEVRKVQSALAVLQRIVPILQAPHLMRQHLENNRFSEALKAYRRVLVIDDHCNIDLLNNVKAKAAEAAREARRDLEFRLAQDKASLSSLLEGIRDLSELLELEVPEGEEEEANKPGVFEIGEKIIHVREHTPALACLLLQAAHFKLIVQKNIALAEQSANRIYDGETLAQVQALNVNEASQSADASTNQAGSLFEGMAGDGGKAKASGNQWKYDILDARVIATIRAVDVIRNWLPRLLHIGTAAHESEKRRAARVVRRRGDKIGSDASDEEQLSAFHVFLSTISPDVSRMVDHATFCALGSTSRGSGKEVKMTFGQNAPEKLCTLLKSPLPPTQSSKSAKELAELVQVIGESSFSANSLRPSDKDYFETYSLSPLDECKQMAEEAVVTVERRRCIFAFDVCARTCSSRASGSGRFDGDALLTCLRTLSEELTRPEECASEVEKGCELVVRRCCEGLAGYVRDRGDSARLRAVAECAEALTGSLHDVVREVDYMGGHSAGVEEVMEEDVIGLESAMFDEYLENVRSNVAGCCRIGWLDMDSTGEKETENRDISAPATFPAYLSASLLAIVRCRAQVERALSDKVRRSEGVSYQYLAMATAADGVVEGICNEIKKRKTKMKVRQADRMANELQFLMNTLKSYLSDENLSLIENTRRTLCSRAGRGSVEGGGPDGLAALEELERLGRVYVLCLGEATATST